MATDSVRPTIVFAAVRCPASAPMSMVASATFRSCATRRSAGSVTEPNTAGFGGFLSNRRAPESQTRTCPATCPELGNSDLRQPETDTLNRVYLRHLARKRATYKPKVVGSNPTGGIEK